MVRAAQRDLSSSTFFTSEPPRIGFFRGPYLETLGRPSRRQSHFVLRLHQVSDDLAMLVR